MGGSPIAATARNHGVDAPEYGHEHKHEHADSDGLVRRSTRGRVGFRFCYLGILFGRQVGVVYPTGMANAAMANITSASAPAPRRIPLSCETVTATRHWRP